MPEHPGWVVAFGSSAGGLHVYQALLGDLPADASYIICQHLSPAHDSMLVEILARSTELEVRQIVDDDQLVAGCIHIAPPNTDIEIVDGRFRLIETEGGPRPSINRFLRSAATCFGPRVVAVQLSGTGTDGIAGSNAVRRAGGMILVQTPGTAAFPAMPTGVIRDLHPDFVGAPAELAEFINRIVSDQVPDSVTPAESKDLGSLVSLVEEHLGVQLSYYRESSLRRRLTRRLETGGFNSVADYVAELETNADERALFLGRAFVHVSELFRDPESFARLREVLLKRLEEFDEDVFRVWVPGCANGQEAYTIAMILLDIGNELDRAVPFKILATDIAAEVIGAARDGEYPVDQARSVPAEFEGRYFVRTGDTVVMSNITREHVIFSTHDVLRDPPFLRVDLVSCRNLLIYLTEAGQARAIDLFRYALSPDGLLFVGSSELPRDQALLETVDRGHRIFRRRPGAMGTKPLLQLRPSRAFDRASRRPPSSGNSSQGPLEALNAVFAPTSAVVDAEGQLVYTTPGMAAFLRQPEGFVTNRFIDRVQPELRSAMRGLLFRAMHDAGASTPVTLTFELDGAWKRITASSVENEGMHWCVVSIEPSPVDNVVQQRFSAADSDPATPRAFLERELSTTRENLQIVIEELEAANEQMQVYNEQLQSSNEEYVSTNEELQTLNEELQATNEELSTVNDELKDRTARQEQLAIELRSMQESLQLVPMFVTDPDLRVRFASGKVDAVVEAEVVRLGDLLYALPWRNEIVGLREIAREALQSGNPQLIDLDVEHQAFRCRIAPFLTSDDQVGGVTVMFTDVTSLKQAERALLHERDRAQKTLAQLSEAVIRIGGDHTVDYMNSSAERLLGRRLDDVLGEPIAEHLSLWDGDRKVDLEEMLRSARATGDVNAATDTFYRLEPADDDDSTLLSVTLTPVFDEDTGAFFRALLTLQDVTERQGYLRQLLWNSKHDDLTNLINRTEVEDRIARVVSQAQETKVASTLMYLDLDQFKIINDTCGHAAGDQLLQQVASLLAQTIKPGDTLARIGGDEFVILLDGVAMREGRDRAQQILDSISKYTFVWRERVFKIGISIGLVEIGASSRSVSDVLSEADTACYTAKQDGRNCIRMSDSASNFLAKQRSEMAVISDISDALERDGFELHFQQIRPISSAAPYAWEALIRMRRGETLLYPGDFLPAAERFGIVKRLDLWVVDHVIGLLDAPSCEAEPTICINVSGLSVADSAFADFVERRVCSSQIDPKQLCFELTETAAMGNVERVTEFIDRMHALGCRVALDDFGTGTSSLAYLRELPIDIVKIDALFTQSLGTEDVNRYIVEAVAKVAHHLDVSVVAEGVETATQLEALRVLGIDLGQGWHLSRPVPEVTFLAEVAMPVIDLGDGALLP